MRAIEPIAYNGPISTERRPVPELRWIEIAALRVDEAYQRPIQAVGARTIRAIVAGFDWRMFGPVVVSPVEGGCYAIVDGQHRTTAAATCGIDKVPCLVIQADRQTQAKAFSAINGRVTKMSSVAFFKARLAGGDDRARALAAACAEAGVTLLPYPVQARSQKPGETMAVATIERCFDEFGRAKLVRALKALVAAAGGAPGLVIAATIQGFCEVLADHPEWRDDPRLVDVSADFKLERKLAKARKEAAAKRTPVLPFVEAELITFYEGSLARTPSRRAA